MRAPVSSVRLVHVDLLQVSAGPSVLFLSYQIKKLEFY
jgi:hypothetical protein